ncbi:MAG: type II toxin-antitoxin system Phd/YefM family antitoxin [bacterium]
MRKLASSKIKGHFGEVLDSAQQEPITIEKKGQPVAVLLSLEKFQRLEAVEEAMWAMKARISEKEGFVGTKRKTISRSLEC